MNRGEQCAITAILPEVRFRHVMDEVMVPMGLPVLTWRARGTLLKDSWFQRFLPAVSPGKMMLRTVVPQSMSQLVIRNVAASARLHQQATGAVYSERCYNLAHGARSVLLPKFSDDLVTSEQSLTQDELSLICCIVDKQHTDRITRAAILAGAHGPVVQLVEGRGLRDRLGWLRITKLHEKDLILVLCAKSEGASLFHEMATAGELSKPGRGFMYRLNVDEGIFNLPSRLSSHHYAANVQQIINAIDHLSGHTHWRDGGFRAVGAGIQSSGLVSEDEPDSERLDMQCLSAVLPRADHDVLIEHALDCGAKGVNFSFAALENLPSDEVGPAKIQQDYALLQCVASASVISQIHDSLEANPELIASSDWLSYATPVVDRATYVYTPGQKDNRRSSARQTDRPHA
ncbi:MAG: hypothetical protein AAGA84_06965 [Pseudomonadota bacterium]